MLVKLSKPFTPPGADAKPVTELELKVEDLTGAHVLKASREADAKRGGPAAGHEHGVIPGAGDGQIPHSIRDAVRTGYHGYAVMEPHLRGGGPTGLE